MPLPPWLRALPPYQRLAVAVIGVVLLAAVALAAVANSRPRPHPTAEAVPTPSASLGGSASPSTSPSASPDQSPSPSPAPSPADASPAQSTAPAPAGAAPPPPPPPAAGCSGPAGGFPGSQLAANYPVALAWSPNGRLFWAERSGTIRVYQGGAAKVFATVATSTSGERGLLGLAISGAYVYALYSDTNPTTQTIVRWSDCGGNAINRVVIASGLPAGSDCCHKGGRLAVSPDGAHLFATIGDNHVAPAAQNWGDLRGKVIRYDLDGGGRTVWTAGLRNPFGIAFAPDGRLAVTNNGPSTDAGTPCGACGDIFDLVGTSPGVLYQWATCWGYSHTFGGSTSCSGREPDYSTESTHYFVAPTGATWAASGAFAGHFLFCTQNPGTMFEYLGTHSVNNTQIGGCSLDVKQGPDGAIYTSDAGAIYRH